ncbi:MAG: hypothetical protein ACRC3G_02885, partial [Bacteroidales bacterium]
PKRFAQKDRGAQASEGFIKRHKCFFVFSEQAATITTYCHKKHTSPAAYFTPFFWTIYNTFLLDVLCGLSESKGFL